MIIIDWLKELHSPEGITQIISQAGLPALVGIIFSETGLLLGFFLPGDSLLVTAGLLTSSQLTGSILSFEWSLLMLTCAAIIGNQVGYFLGCKSGEKIFSRNDSFFFKKKHAEEAHNFYQTHGGKAIIMAQFVPILRTFVPFVAGVAKMNYKQFALFNICGALIWVPSMLSLGHFIGRTPLGEKIHLVILTVIAVSILPLVIGILKKLLKNKSTNV